MALFPKIITFIWHVFFLYHSTFIWHYFVVSPQILPHLYLWLYCCICPHLYLALFHHISSWHLLRGGAFLHPPLLVTLTLHLLPYYSTLMWHFLRASPRSISTLLNMVSFSLFLSHLYMTLILFIIPRQYYSPQLLQGFSAEGFHITFCFQLDLSHIFPWLFFSKSQFYMDCMGGFYIQGLSAEGFNHRIFLYFLPFLLSAACPRKVFLLNIWSK